MWSIVLLLMGSAMACAVVGENNANTITSDYPLGNPWRCVERAKAKGYHLENLEVLPGFGWDNLRNTDEGQVVSYNYSQCRTTDDGRFLLPDSVSAVPIKTTNAELYAEFIDHWKNWTSDDSFSINIDAGFKRMSTAVSGKFSLDFMRFKSTQINENSVATRAQLRYTRYSVQLQPDSQLHPSFKQRIMGIVSAYLEDSNDKGNFLCELLIRDFGTHIVTKAVAGASLIQMDFLQKQWVNDMKKNGLSASVLATASFNLFKTLRASVSIGGEVNITRESIDEYISKKTSSRILTKGGTPFLPSNFTATAWAESVDKDLVALDRSGDPLYYVITQEALPGVRPFLLKKVYDGVRAAVETYYSYNLLPGCTEPGSPNFSPAANVDDGSCKQKYSSNMFGGVYQKCRMIESANGDLCKNLQRVNPLSGSDSCPDGYTSVTLNSGITTSSRAETKCEKKWFRSKRCSTKHLTSTAKYEMSWCAPKSTRSGTYGYFFGGVHTKQVDNPITGTASCPTDFYTLQFGDQSDLRICISDAQGEKHAVPFGGFYSCRVGNPIVILDKDAPTNSLLGFFQDKPSEWPKGCPPGFSSYLASVDQGCQINFCISSTSLPDATFPPIKRPPFSPDPSLPASCSEEFSYDPVSHAWSVNDQ